MSTLDKLTGDLVIALNRRHPNLDGRDPLDAATLAYVFAVYPKLRALTDAASNLKKQNTQGALVMLDVAARDYARDVPDIYSDRENELREKLRIARADFHEARREEDAARMRLDELRKPFLDAEDALHDYLKICNRKAGQE